MGQRPAPTGLWHRGRAIKPLGCPGGIVKDFDEAVGDDDVRQRCPIQKIGGGLHNIAAGLASQEDPDLVGGQYTDRQGKSILPVFGLELNLADHYQSLSANAANVSPRKQRCLFIVRPLQIRFGTIMSAVEALGRRLSNFLQKIAPTWRSDC